MDKPQILYHGENPAFVVLPFEIWQKFSETFDKADLDDETLAMLLAVEPDKAEDYRPFVLVERMSAGEIPLKVYREWRNISQRSLAETVGVSLSHISKIECGLKVPSNRLKMRLAEALSIDPEELDNWQEDEESQEE